MVIRPCTLFGPTPSVTVNVRTLLDSPLELADWLACWLVVKKSFRMSSNLCEKVPSPSPPLRLTWVVVVVGWETSTKKHSDSWNTDPKFGIEWYFAAGILPITLFHAVGWLNNFRVDQMRAGPPEVQAPSPTRLLAKNSNTTCTYLVNVCLQKNVKNKQTNKQADKKNNNKKKTTATTKNTEHSLESIIDV